jgi:hypothetical protein
MVAEWHGHQQEAEGEAKIMASTYQRGEWYWGKVQRNGVPHRFPLRTKDPAIAETRLASRVKELDAPRGAIGGEWTVDEAADRFVDEHFPNLKPKAIRRYRASLRWLLPVFGHMKLADLSSKDLSAFETERPDSGWAADIRRYRQARLGLSELHLLELRGVGVGLPQPSAALHPRQGQEGGNGRE